ncbi:MAG: hypothetical protein ACXWE4_11095, partial [Methylobacter sp.]
MKKSAYILLVFLGLATPCLQAAIINKTFCIGSLSKTLSGKSVNFWGYSDCSGGGMGGGMMGGATVPGPILEIGAGD